MSPFIVRRPCTAATCSSTQTAETVLVVQNSNLVLTAETRTREATEPSGEPETLWGRMKGKMGDRVQYGKPEEERKGKTKKKLVLCCPLPSSSSKVW